MLVLNACPYISIQKCQENEFQKILYNWPISITTKAKSAKAIALIYYHIRCWKKRTTTGRPKKLTQQVERRIIKTVYDSPQSSATGLALQKEKGFLKNTNIVQECPTVSTKCRKKLTICNRIRFTCSRVLALCYFLRWDENNAVLSWKTANKHLIPTSKVRKTFRNGIGLYIQEV